MARSSVRSTAPGAGGGGSGAPTDADYLVGTANGGLSAEIVVGATPGGELGGTWATPTVDATHSGSAHHASVTIGADAEHSLAGQVLSGVDASTSQKGHAKVGADTPSTQAFGDAAAVGAGDGAANTLHKHAMPADPVTAHSAAADPHAGYVLESLLDAKGDLIAASADNTPSKVTVGADKTLLVADSSQAGGLRWASGDPWRAVARTTGDQSWTSDVVLADITGLSFAIAASEIWAFHAVLMVGFNSTGDIQVAVTTPAGATLAWNGLGLALTEASTNGAPLRFSGSTNGNYVQTTSGTALAWGILASPSQLIIDGIVVNSSTAGSVALQAAQNTSNGTASKVYANSFLIGTRIA
jgi:hypothetical protein